MIKNRNIGNNESLDFINDLIPKLESIYLSKETYTDDKVLEHLENGNILRIYEYYSNCYLEKLTK